MPEKENSAFRLYRLVGKMISQPPNLTTAQALLNAVGKKDVKQGRPQSIFLSQAVSLVFAELDSLIEETSLLNFSDESRQTVVGALDRLSVTTINQQWQNHVPAFIASVSALRIFGEGLPDEGPPISPSDLSDLLASVLSLREDVEKSALPYTVKRFVYEQLNTIERAIREYPIAGIKAFSTAAKDTWFQGLEHPDDEQELGKTEFGTKLRVIKEKVIAWSKVATLITGLLAATNSAVENAEKLEHTAGKVIHEISTVVNNTK